MEGKVAKVSLEVRTGEATGPHRAYGEARSPERTCACGVYHAVLNATPVKTPKFVKRVFGSALLQQTTRALLPGGGNSPRSIYLLVFTYVQ